MILESAYFGNIAYYQKIVAAQPIYIHDTEIFQKSTHRNRCTILTANGVQTLTIPIIGGRGIKKQFSEIQISYDTPWQRIHKNAIQSAYGKTPFFEFYGERILNIYNTKPTFLLDWNQSCLELSLQILKISKPVVLYSTIESMEENPSTESINPSFSPYYQAFSDRFPFTPNLSILDLLFNEGNKSIGYLRR